MPGACAQPCSIEAGRTTSSAVADGHRHPTLAILAIYAHIGLFAKSRGMAIVCTLPQASTVKRVCYLDAILLLAPG
jgi:hypothetical protein